MASSYTIRYNKWCGEITYVIEKNNSGDLIVTKSQPGRDKMLTSTMDIPKSLADIKDQLKSEDEQNITYEYNSPESRASQVRSFFYEAVMDIFLIGEEHDCKDKEFYRIMESFIYDFIRGNDLTPILNDGIINIQTEICAK